MKVKYNVSNFRGSYKDLGLIKGAIRRVFSRSELRKEILNTAIVEHYDPNRTRVKTWYKCVSCNNFNAGYEMQVDHIQPIVAITETLKDIDCNTLIDRTWCINSNLQPICLTCHKIKSTIENRARREYKKYKGGSVSTGFNNRKKNKKLIKKAKENNIKKGAKK